MDRTLRSEVATSGSPSRDKSKVYVIVGAPHRGKTDLALDIINLVPELNLSFVDVPNPPEYALGEMADYRAELYHSLHRYFVQMEHFKKGQNIIVTHSLIDSFAWATFNAQRKLNSNIDPQAKEIFAATLIGQIMMDSFYADHIFIIDGTEDPDDSEIYIRLSLVAALLDIPHTYLYEEDQEEWPEICATIIRKNG